MIEDGHKSVSQISANRQKKGELAHAATQSRSDTVGLQAVKQFPELGNYTNCWPVSDFMQLRLHYTAGQHAILLRKVSVEVEAAAEATLKRARSSAARGKISGTTKKKTRAGGPTNSASE